MSDPPEKSIQTVEELQEFLNQLCKDIKIVKKLNLNIILTVSWHLPSPEMVGFGYTLV